MCTSGDIFKAKSEEILCEIEGVKMSTDDVSVLRKNNLPNIYKSTQNYLFRTKQSRTKS